MKDKNSVVLNAVKQLKEGEFKATAVKIELEGNLFRGRNELDCLRFILNKLGISYGSDDIESGVEDHYPRTPWYALRPTDHPIKYLRFYNDGSVDSEITATVSLKNPENILWLPKIIEAWNALSNDEGGCDTQGAGMHIALLNNTGCNYPATNRVSDTPRFQNFKRSMSLLLPTLYFLASQDAKSRWLQYRKPRITQYNRSLHQETKYNAITHKQGSIEFRVFETCYGNPEAVLDNIVVIKNCMKYWSTNYRDPGLYKVVQSIHFGNDNSRDLERFYTTVEHVKLLNEGLRRLKPSYYTIQELKKQRSFTVNQYKIRGRTKEVIRDARKSYREYSERYRWNALKTYYENVAFYLGDGRFTERLAKERAKSDLQKGLASKKSLAEYIQEKVNNMVVVTGDYTLGVS